MRGATPRRRITAALAGLLLVVAAVVAFSGSAAATSSGAPARGALDCNGWSKSQQTTKSTGACTDVRGFTGVKNSNNWDGRFYDNGHYIGHDEPDLTFLSHKPGSGNNVTWTERLPHDPIAVPSVNTPGSDVTHWFELSIAPWFSMALCNQRSYPLNPCTPNSDNNAPTDSFTGAGSSFLEVQFYPPGYAPFFDSISCDNLHWCASLHINDLECTFNFDSCNPNCEEPTNFAFIQKDGVPTGPPAPQDANLDTSTPNSQTLLMNPGDKLRVHIFDAPAPGGGNALEVQIDDLTTHQTGFMQASAHNGYKATRIVDCSGTPFNYEPEYSTAQKQNIVPWAALQTDISTQYEIGHFTPCTSLSDPATDGLLGFTAGDPFWMTCNGPYENKSDSASDNPEGQFGDAFCYPQGDTHSTLYPPGTYNGGSVPPNQVTGCLDFLSGGDIDFDGTSYYADWPTGITPTNKTPSSFLQSAPATGKNGQGYEQSFFQTDVALSEEACAESADTSGCTVPPNGPGNFYPYFSTLGHGPSCQILFGNVSGGFLVNDYGKDAQYGTDLRDTIGYDEFEGPVGPNLCTGGHPGE
jgi:hypothetical protein